MHKPSDIFRKRIESIPKSGRLVSKVMEDVLEAFVEVAGEVLDEKAMNQTKGEK